MKPKRKKSILQRKSRYAYILIAPGLLLISFIMIYPLIRGVISSFFTQKAASMHFEEFAGFRYYIELLADKTFKVSLKNSIIYTLVVVTSQYLVGLAIALLLNKKFKGRGIYRSLVLIPW